MEAAIIQQNKKVLKLCGSNDTRTPYSVPFRVADRNFGSEKFTKRT